ncbi:MAG: oxaloacetate decarboxylase [Pseudomonadota bacterium]|nr:oxaloacetate decarboxylase [Pseudomonadota bacterium]
MKSNSLTERLKNNQILLTPGIFDAFGAMMAERAGFEALYLSGASIAYTKLGRPDIGLITMNELAYVVSNIRERSGLPLIVDADTGFGNALNVQRTVKVLERAGATAIQLEDQSLPKRCGHLEGKSLVSIGEMQGKIKAAVDVRESRQMLIIARTDAMGVAGFNAAIERAHAYIEAGADILFIEALISCTQMSDAIKQCGSKIPLLINMVEGGKTPMLSAKDLEKIGFSIVIFPGGLVRALAYTAEKYFKSLHENGTTLDYQDNMYSFDQLNTLLGTNDILRAAKKYDRFGD